MQITKTVIVQVFHADGDPAVTPSAEWQTAGLDVPLFEVLQGPHEGKRGSDVELLDLVGPIHFNEDIATIYETGRITSAYQCPVCATRSTRLWCCGQKARTP